VDDFLSREKKRQKSLPVDEYLDVVTEVLTISKKDNFDYVRDKVVHFIYFD